MAIGVTSLRASTYIPFGSEVEALFSLASGGTYLSIAAALKISELMTGQKTNLLITEDAAAFYAETGKNLLKEGVAQIQTMGTGIVIGLVFSVWLQRYA